ncbi:hypothetical protein HF1_01570 [Mycoplasma haemofelis str. Langford 1]|uniref:Uncharacterized protein n=2 Tax=Mycoplasma haemofelis TaxID=29501 RepID=F6FG11_MYCHI|nr:hypothetical protein [Mycoplasma haemofelis]AEG72477.1 hypothetical protein MHF_0178 [Mycoplasma haemofelis Ohio2]CBY92165.1 hypothetical protein HF1_01570 [Mycoplasma haemofelis str. Langford 1]
MKGTYVATSLAGVGAVGGASALYFYKGGDSVETLRSKFAGALIEDTETTIWDAKWDALKKGSVNGDNENLKLALSKKDGNSEQEGKDALKRGCKELYESPFKNREDKNFLDFKSYCAKNNKEKAGGSELIAKVDTDEGWGTKWTNLKSHQGDIDSELEDIKKKDTTSQEAERKKEIKAWCEKVASELFELESVRYKNFVTYCKP